jgi:predicted alpha/beta hydrolase family esterase
VKNALILHGTDADSHSNWFPWLKEKLEERDWKVWVPDLPGADAPNTKRYNGFLLSQGWDFNDETVIIGHSSGAVSALKLLPALPDEVRVKAAVLVAAFKDDLGWDSLAGLFEEPFDFEKIKSRAGKFIFIHSDDDPYCPLSHAEFLAAKVDGEVEVIPGQKHFSVGTAGEHYREFPRILEVIGTV